jgi:peptide chain release factor 1
MKFNLDTLVTEFESLEQELSNPEIFKDQKKVKQVSTRKKSIEEAVTLYREYKSLNETLEENKEMLASESDGEMKDLIKMEI